jgi:integrase
MQLNITLEQRQGPSVWSYRWRESGPDGKPVRHRIIVGNLEQFPTEKSVQEALTGIIREINSRDIRIRATPMTLQQLVDHYRLRELRPNEDSRNPEFVLADDDKHFSTLQTYQGNLKNWILPRWGAYLLSDIKTVEVESWLKTLNRRGVQPTRLAYGTRAKIRAVMKTLFNHAKRYELFDRNPIALVRQRGRRRRIPEILTVEDVQQLLAVLPAREFVMVLLDLTTGLRLSELFALQWQDIDIPNLRIKVVRSIVKQRVGRCKTEMSKKPVPLDPRVAMFVQEWYHRAVYSGPSDWVFASPDTSGKKPYWGAPIMRKQIKPLAQSLGITRLEGWHTFRHTYSSLLADGETKLTVVQALMRHASIRTTLDGYTQALTPSKRKAQSAVVSRLSLSTIVPEVNRVELNRATL